MKMSDKGLAQLASEEGMVLGFYKDGGGVETWGIGITKAGYGGFDRLSPNPTHREVIEQFKRDVAKYERGVKSALEVNVPVTQTQFDALNMFHYNTGGIHKAALTRKLNAGDVAGAAKAFMGWSKPKSIIPRRKREQALFRDGTYSDMPIAVYASGGKKRLGSMSVSEFIKAMHPPRPDMAQDDQPDAKPEDIFGAAPIERHKPMVRNPAIALAATGAVAGVVNWWDQITAWLGGLFG